MLSGVRVLDLTGEPGWLAGKILGDLGADVIKVEPPRGDPGRRRGPFLGGHEDPERCLRWLALNTSKRSVVLDLGAADGCARFRALAATADVVLETAPPGHWDRLGIGPRGLLADLPALVWCAITPFGQQGPYAGYRGGDLVVVAMGGNLAKTGDPDRPPVRCTLPTGYLHAAPEAALGCVMALFAREQSGRGQLVDVSMHECQLQSLLSFPGQYALTGREAARSGARTGRTREIWRAKDGWISFGLRGGPARIPNLVATVAYMDECGMAPAWLRDYDWQGYSHVTVSDEDIARFEEAFGAFFRTKTMRELYDEALARRILLAPCNDAREILEHAQLRARGLFTRLACPDAGVEIEQPAFFAVADGIGVRGPAPRIGEHTDEVLGALEVRAPRERARQPRPRQVFAGLRVLELGSGAAGPVAARYFAEQGARVLRIESHERPDFLRLYALGPDNPHGLDGAPMFVLLNPNKESVAINLTKPEGVEIVKRLVAWADVVAENFAPGVMDKFGLDRATLRALNPDVVSVSNCLFGQTGPQRAYPGFGGQGSAIAGFNHVTGWPDREAIGPFATITDSLSPRYVALAVAAALLRRRCTGEGAHVDVSQIEAGVYSLSELVARYSATGEVMTRQGNRDEHAAPHGVFPVRGEDRWIAIAVTDDAEWQALVRTLDLPDDPRFATAEGRRTHQDEIERELAARTATRDAHALMHALQSAGVPAGVVQSMADLVDDPQLAARNHFRRLRHVHLGPLLFEHSGLVFSDSPRSLSAPGPNLGEHTRPVLEELLGLSAERIDELEAAGVLG